MRERERDMRSLRIAMSVIIIMALVQPIDNTDDEDDGDDLSISLMNEV